MHPVARKQALKEADAVYARAAEAAYVSYMADIAAAERAYNGRFEAAQADYLRDTRSMREDIAAENAGKISHERRPKKRTKKRS